MKKLQFNFLLTILFAAILTGCASLAPDGPYKGDTVLYTADRTISGSFEAMRGFVRWEKANRQVLSKWPEIKQAADHVRVNAKRWRDSAVAMRDAYKSHPSDGNKKNLELTLDILNTAAQEAANYMAKK